MRRLIILAEVALGLLFASCTKEEQRTLSVISRTIKGGITAGSVFIEFGNRVIYRCV